MKSNKKKDNRVLLAIAIVLGGSSVAAGLYAIGVRRGENNLVEELIHISESGKKDWPVFTSSDKKLGNLMYELSAECIGD